MNIELIFSPSKPFIEMLLNNIRPQERHRFEQVEWGAVGLIQSRLLELYWAADVAAKASDVRVALVLGNCPQHVQMLAIVGRQAAVQAAVAKIRQHKERRPS